MADYLKDLFHKNLHITFDQRIYEASAEDSVNSERQVALTSYQSLVIAVVLILIICQSANS